MIQINVLASGMNDCIKAFSILEVIMGDKGCERTM